MLAKGMKTETINKSAVSAVSVSYTHLFMPMGGKNHLASFP